MATKLYLHRQIVHGTSKAFQACTLDHLGMHLYHNHSIQPGSLDFSLQLLRSFTPTWTDRQRLAWKHPQLSPEHIQRRSLPVQCRCTSNCLGLLDERRAIGFKHRLWHWVTVIRYILRRFGLGNLPYSQTCLINEWQDGKLCHDHHTYRRLPGHHHSKRPIV